MTEPISDDVLKIGATVVFSDGIAGTVAGITRDDNGKPLVAQVQIGTRFLNIDVSSLEARPTH